MYIILMSLLTFPINLHQTSSQKSMSRSEGTTAESISNTNNNKHQQNGCNNSTTTTSSSACQTTTAAAAVYSSSNGKGAATHSNNNHSSDASEQQSVFEPVQPYDPQGSYDWTHTYLKRPEFRAVPVKCFPHVS